MRQVIASSVLVAGVVTGGPAVAQAQAQRSVERITVDGAANGQMRLPREILRRDLEWIAEFFDLDKDQDPILESIFLDYERDYEVAAKQLGARVAELRPKATVTDEQRQQRRALQTQMQKLQAESRGLQRQIDQARKRGDEAAAVATLERQASDLNTRVKSLRQQLMDLWPRPDDDAIQAWRQSKGGLARESRDVRDRLKVNFLTNLQTILSGDQLARWPSFERRFNREKLLPKGRFSGERVDLFLVLRDVDVDADGALSPAMEAYAQTLDAALLAREVVLDEHRFERGGLIKAGKFDTAIAMTQRETDARVRVRDTNDQYVEIVAEALAVADGDGRRIGPLRAAYLRRAFPNVFRTGTVERTFETARGLDGLSDDSLSTIIAMEGQYQMELDAVNERVVRTLRVEQPKLALDRLRERAKTAQAGPGREQPKKKQEAAKDDPMRAAFLARSSLDTRTRAELERLLTPEQIAVLPKPERQTKGGTHGTRNPKPAGNLQRRQRPKTP